MAVEVEDALWGAPAVSSSFSKACVLPMLLAWPARELRGMVWSPARNRPPESSQEARPVRPPMHAHGMDMTKGEKAYVIIIDAVDSFG
jgi:hypothetical protein